MKRPTLSFLQGWNVHLFSIKVEKKKLFIIFASSKTSGCGAARLAHLHGVQGVAGSNPVTPTLTESSGRKFRAFLYRDILKKC